MTTEILKIEDAKYIDGYRLSLKFSDGKSKVVDFADFILNSQHPDIKKYSDVELFKGFSLKHGDLHWNDYDLAFSVYDLYQGAVCRSVF